MRIPTQTRRIKVVRVEPAKFDAIHIEASIDWIEPHPREGSVGLDPILHVSDRPTCRRENVRFWLYACTLGLTIDQLLARSPTGSTGGFAYWITERSREYRIEQGRSADLKWTREGHQAFDRWLHRWVANHDTKASVYLYP